MRLSTRRISYLPAYQACGGHPAPAHAPIQAPPAKPLLSWALRTAPTTVSWRAPRFRSARTATGRVRAPTAAATRTCPTPPGSARPGAAAGDLCWPRRVRQCRAVATDFRRRPQLQGRVSGEVAVEPRRRYRAAEDAQEQIVHDLGGELPLRRWHEPAQPAPGGGRHQVDAGARLAGGDVRAALGVPVDGPEAHQDGDAALCPVRPGRGEPVLVTGAAHSEALDQAPALPRRVHLSDRLVDERPQQRDGAPHPRLGPAVGSPHRLR